MRIREVLKMPPRLNKQTEDEFSPLMNKWDRWVQTHLTLILTVLMLFLFFLVLALIVAMFNVSAAPTGTEANLYYNHLENIV